MNEYDEICCYNALFIFGFWNSNIEIMERRFACIQNRHFSVFESKPVLIIIDSDSDHY